MSSSLSPKEPVSRSTSMSFEEKTIITSEYNVRVSEMRTDDDG